MIFLKKRWSFNIEDIDWSVHTEVLCKFGSSNHFWQKTPLFSWKKKGLRKKYVLLEVTRFEVSLSIQLAFYKSCWIMFFKGAPICFRKYNEDQMMGALMSFSKCLLRIYKKKTSCGSGSSCSQMFCKKEVHTLF